MRIVRKARLGYPMDNQSNYMMEWSFDDGLPLDIIHVQRHGSTDLHTHHFSELVIVLQGSGLHISPAGSYTIAAGDVFVLHGNQAHGYQDTAELELVNILFRVDELAIPLLDVTSLPGWHALFTLEPLFRERDSFESRLRLTADQLQIISDLLRRLIHEHESAIAGNTLASLAYFILIVVELSRYYSHIEDPSAQQLLRLGRVIGHIQENYAEQFTLDDLAQVGYMSRRTLTREFKRTMNCSPIEYLIRLRINRAIDLLRRSNASITDIACRVGFQDSSYFARQFRAIVGYSPRQFRERDTH